jgi:predicted branched-subunit amino acid permease
MSISRPTQELARTGFLATGLSIFVLWNGFTLVGAVAGEALGDPRTYGLDAAVCAAFLALLWPRLADRRNQLVAVLAVAVALGLVPVTAAGVPVLAAAGVALLVGVLSSRPDPTEFPEAHR